jgi:hypothetical protein
VLRLTDPSNMGMHERRSRARLVRIGVRSTEHPQRAEGLL